MTESFFTINFYSIMGCIGLFIGCIYLFMELFFWIGKRKKGPKIIEWLKKFKKKHNPHLKRYFTIKLIHGNDNIEVSKYCQLLEDVVFLYNKAVADAGKVLTKDDIIMVSERNNDGFEWMGTYVSLLYHKISVLDAHMGVKGLFTTEELQSFLRISSMGIASLHYGMK